MVKSKANYLLFRILSSTFTLKFLNLKRDISYCWSLGNIKKVYFIMIS